MPLEMQVNGGGDFHALATQIRTEGRKDLSKQLSRALNNVTEPIRRDVRSEADKAMPESGGYQELLSASLRFRNNRRTGGQQASLRMTTYADGRKERRDIVALERGTLRHPLWGDRDHWYVTKVRAGFHERGTESAADEAIAQLDKVVRDFTRKLIS